MEVKTLQLAGFVTRMRTPGCTTSAGVLPRIAVAFLLGACVALILVASPIAPFSAHASQNASAIAAAPAAPGSTRYYGNLPPCGRIQAIAIPFANPCRLTREQDLTAYMLRLEVAPESDVNGLIKYWGKGGREKFIAPLIASLGRIPGGGAINVSYLLPPFARLRLYTYPDAWKNDAAEQFDCVFSALNFFNDTPDTRLSDLAYRETVLNSRYALVAGQPTYGDLVTLLDAQNQVIHMCVYIADGFVFTKNGFDQTQPWVLMRMSDMLLMYYSFEKPSRIEFLRPKDIG